MTKPALDPVHAHLPFADALNIAQAHFGPDVVLQKDDTLRLAYSLYDPTTQARWRGLSWRSVLRAARLICDERAGYGYHGCTRPPDHDGDCMCWCGEQFGPPF